MVIWWWLEIQNPSYVTRRERLDRGITKSNIRKKVETTKWWTVRESNPPTVLAKHHRQPWNMTAQVFMIHERSRNVNIVGKDGIEPSSPSYQDGILTIEIHASDLVRNSQTANR